MMIHPDILAALARERSGTFRAAAQAARRARQARRHRQPGRVSGIRTTPPRRLLPWLQRRSLRPGGPPRLAAEGTPVVLRDGSAVLIRQVRSYWRPRSTAWTGGSAAWICRCRKPVPPGQMLRWSLAVQPGENCAGVG